MLFLLEDRTLLNKVGKSLEMRVSIDYSTSKSRIFQEVDAMNVHFAGKNLTFTFVAFCRPVLFKVIYLRHIYHSLDWFR